MSKQTDITKWSVVTKAQGSRWSSPVQETPELAVWAHVELTDDEDEPVPTRVPSPLPLPPSPPIDPRDIPWLSAANGASSSNEPPATGDDIPSWQFSPVNEENFDFGEESREDGVEPETAMPKAVTPKPTRRRASRGRGRPADRTGEGDIAAGRTSPRGRTRSRTRARIGHRLRRMNAKDFTDVVPLISYGNPDAESSSVTTTTTTTMSLGSEAVTSDVAATAIDSEDVPVTAAENDGVRPRRFWKRRKRNSSTGVATIDEVVAEPIVAEPTLSAPTSTQEDKHKKTKRRRTCSPENAAAPRFPAVFTSTQEDKPKKKNAAAHATPTMQQPHLHQALRRSRSPHHARRPL